MRIAIIGRTEMLYESIDLLTKAKHEVCLIFTAKESPEYTKKAEDFKILADKLGIPYHCSAQINKKEYIEELKALNLDLGISMNYINVISKEVVNSFRLGVLNAHAGDLPKYRGNACQAWALINGEEKIGLCIHQMVGGELDSGDIISRDYLVVNINTKVTEVIKWMDNRIPNLFLDAANKLSENSKYVLEVQSKDPKDILRGYPRKPEDGKINWKDSAETILRLINACNKPFYGAFCDYEGKEIKIWDAELLEDGENFLAIPGQVAHCDRVTGSVTVICGEGKLKINEIEIDGQVSTPIKQIKSIRKRLK